MTKSLAASQKVMRSYLSELLTDDESASVKAPAPIKEPEHKPLEKLLEKVAPSQELPIENKPLSRKPVEEKVKEPAVVPEVIQPVQEPAVDAPLSTNKSEGALKVSTEKDYRSGNFQAMFFSVAGLTIAVPLIELGGIHNTEKTTQLMGKPDWFDGVMLHREEKINVVNTARWVMPEKCTEELLEALEYQYVIMLSDSAWGLSAEHLVDTVTLNQDDVKWLDEPSKRPWLAGLVKDRMCALLDVEALIKLLDDGSGINQN